MANVNVDTNLDVASKYEILVKQSLGGDSVYIRAKETVEDLVNSGAIDEAQKAEIISNIVTGAVNAITNASMSTALNWAQSEKELGLKKAELEKTLDILVQEALIKESQKEDIINKIRLSKVESKRMYGTSVFDSQNNLVTLDNSGKVFKDIELTEAQTGKVGVEKQLVEQKILESQAAVHKIIADTYVNYGNYRFTGLGEDGVTSITPQHGSYKTLSDTQREIGIEQAKGYTYNAWANALTGSASMLGTAIAAEYAEFDEGKPGGILLDVILNAARNLQMTNTVDTEAEPSYITDPPEEV